MMVENSGPAESMYNCVQKYNCVKGKRVSSNVKIIIVCHQIITNLWKPCEVSAHQVF